ncbi:MAG: hypothetical protein JW775_06610 [Candidatus Aminicenantes bacterium]|nr:hypothetical protein [Candidatus Aminicenantes bacterium]
MDKKSVVCLAFLCVFLTSALQAQFARTYGGWGADYGARIVPAPDNGFIVCARSTSFNGEGLWILKLAVDGTIQREKSYTSWGNLTGVCAARPTADGGCIMVGTGYQNSLWVIKTDPSGDPAWQAFVTAPGEVHNCDICLGPESGFYVTGSVGTDPVTDIWVSRLSSEGDVIWQKTYDPGAAESSGRVASADGGLVVICTQTNAPDSIDKALALRIDALGAVSWRKSFTSTNVAVADIRSIRAVEGGGFLVAGTTFVMKLGSSGAVEWARTYGTTVGLSDIWPTSDGGSIAVGDLGINMLAMKLGTAGDIEWQKVFGGPFLETGRGVVEAVAGDYAVCGDTSSFGVGGIDLCVVRIPTDGEIGTCNFSRNWEGEAAAAVEIASGDIDLPSISDAAFTFEDWTVTVADTAGRSGAFRLCADQKLLTIQTNIGPAVVSWTSPFLGSHVYPSGASVTISATASVTCGGETYNFSNWDGDVTSTGNPIYVAMTDDTSIRVLYYEEWYDPDDPIDPVDIGRCFVATAAYRTPFHPAVRLLRQFRDKRLLMNGLGRALVAAYERWSPPAARVIAGSGPLRVLARALLLPVIAVAFVVLNLGWIPTLLIAAAAAAALMRRRRLTRTA